MESDEEDPFCYRSLKRIKRSQEQTDLCKANPSTKSNSTKQNPSTRSTGSRKYAVKSSKKISKEKCESQEVMHPKFEIETDVSNDVSNDTEHIIMNKSKNHKAKSRTVKQGTLKSECAAPFSSTGESSATKQQPKLLTSETMLRGSVNCRATNHGAGISAISSAPSTTDEPAEKHGQKSPEEYTYNIEPFEQTDDSFICSDVPVKQHLKLQVQTDSQLSEKKQPKTCDLAGGKIRSKVTEKSLGEKRHEDYEEGRCPFCQMPFGALSGQSPNWHTMECMDVPLTTTQECPAGLLCDNTVPSHYRRYAHSLLALHLAGQHQDSNGLSASPGGPAGHSSTDQVTVSPPPTARDIRMGTKRAVPEENQGSGGKSRSLKRKQSSSKPKSGQSESRSLKRKQSSSKPKSGQSESRSLKRKQSSSNPKNGQSSSGTSSSQSLSQSSQNSTGSNGSIKAYFSPTKKSEGCDNRPCEENKDGESDPESDHVLGSLVVSDSDSNQSTETQGEEEKQTETCVDKGNCDIQKSDQDPSSPLPQSKGGSLCDLGNSSMDDFGCGFLAEELDDKTSATGSADAEKTLTDKGVFSDVHLQALSDKNTESQQGCSTACSSTARTSAAPPYAIQKQTSLFSYFKPQCHSATVPQQAGPKGGTPVAPKTSVTNRSLEKNRKSWQGERKTDQITRTKPGLMKSPSEPGKVRPVPALCPDNISVPAPAPSSVGLTNGVEQRTGASQPAVAASSSFRKGSRRQCPFYKRLPGTSITVDAFSYGEIAGCGAYVLTHFHYDHYQGLTKRFAQPLFCSQVTGNLVERQIGVDRKWINRLPLNEPCHIAGVKATLMEANHKTTSIHILHGDILVGSCPGAVIILFELPNGKNLLHTGDFRAAPCMEEYPPLVGVGVDELYLDTTYCDPSHAFPSQKETIEFAVTTALKAVARDPFTLVVCGAYTIGKERIFVAIAQALQTKVCVPAAKKRVLDCLEDARLKGMLTLQWSEGSVHVLPMRQLNAQGLGKHLRQCPQFSSVLAFEPTGWTHSKRTPALDNLRPKFSGRGITVYGVPYSEHSSFLEMKRFVQFLRPKKILPTVNNGNPTSRRKMEAIFRQWLAERTPPPQPGSDSSATQPGSASSATQPSLGTWLARRS